MKHYGDFIPGTHADGPTMCYLSYVINRIAAADLIYLVVLVPIPALAVI